MDCNMILISLGALGILLVALALRFRANDSAVPDSSKYPLKPGAAGGKPGLTGSLTDLELEGQIRSLVDRGKYIEGIKLIRRHREDIGLKEAKEIVDQTARSGNFRLPQQRPSSSKAGIEPAGQAGERVLGLIRQGKKIQAIKELREQTGMGLKEAKDEVDRLEREIL